MAKHRTLWLASLLAVLAACGTLTGEPSADPTPGPDAGASDSATVDAPDPGTPDAADVVPSPPNTLHVFLTSQTHDGAFGDIGQADGYFGADRFCATLADAPFAVAALHGKQWRAWLSTSTTSARTRVFAPMPLAFDYVRPDGQIVFPKGYTSKSPTPLVAIEINELDVPPQDPGLTDVYTGSSPNGDPTASGLDCNAWRETTVTGTGGKLYGMTGWADNVAAGTFDTTWSSTSYGTDYDCKVQRRIYCFEVAP